MVPTHSAASRRRLSLASIVFATLALAACSDSPGSPLSVSPVGRYELIGCTYGGDTNPANMSPSCGTGGSNHYDWSSGSVVVDRNGVVTRTLVVTNTAIGAPQPYSVTTTRVDVGTWTLESEVLLATWSGSSTGMTYFARADRNLIRDNSVWNEAIYFWYRRTP